MELYEPKASNYIGFSFVVENVRYSVNCGVIGAVNVLVSYHCICGIDRYDYIVVRCEGWFAYDFTINVL